MDVAGTGRPGGASSTRDRYVGFAELEAAGSSPSYEALSLAIAADRRALALIDELPAVKRQPNLVLAAARVVGAPLDPAGFVAFLADRWADVAAVALARSTQTNEAARTGAFLPVLAEVDGPVTLIEVGCAAGLCLYPDRYAVSYDGRPPLVAASPVWIDVATAGNVPVPVRPIEVVARIGVDLHPLDVRDTGDRAWLDALVWPEHDVRRARLHAAAELVAAEPPTMLAGDLVDRLDDALDLAETGSKVVVIHSAVLTYVTPVDRKRFAERVRSLPGVTWISNEAPGVVDGVVTGLRPPSGARSRASFVLAVDGVATAIGDPHGAWIRWPD